MRKPSWRMGLVVLAIAGLAAPLFASLGRADVEFTSKPSGLFYKIKYYVEGTPNYCPPDGPIGPLVANAIIPKYCPGTFPNWCYVVLRTDGTGTQGSYLDYDHGDANTGGGLGTSALPDAGLNGLVGLWDQATLGQTPPQPLPSDSTLQLLVNRGTANHVILSMPNITINAVQWGAGGMQTRSDSYHVRSLATYTAIVYDDSSKANGDADRDGKQDNGSAGGVAFFSKVILRSGPDKEIGGAAYQILTLPGVAGFSTSDFILQTHPTAPPLVKLTLRPRANISIDLAGGTNFHTNATVVTTSHVNSVDAVPATSPIGLILLTLALMGSGLWAVMRSREKSVAA
jgi:hypothetical protein